MTLKREYVQNVFDDELFDVNNIKNSLEKICENEPNFWYKYLIACPDLIKYCKQGFIRFENEDDIILLGTSVMFGKHAEMRTYYLWHNSFIGKENSFKPFKTEYHESKSTGEDACILLNGFCHKNINYEIRIYYCNDDELEYPYEIAFKKLDGENVPEKYDEEIIKILKDFKWIPAYSGYFFTCNDDNTLMEKLKKVIEKLQKL